MPAGRPYRVRIEGHTDNKPIHNAQFSDNWEPSTARATELVRLLIMKYGFSPERLSAAGYAEYSPVTDNNSTETRAQNRRVGVVIPGKLWVSRAALSAHPAAGIEHADPERFRSLDDNRRIPAVRQALTCARCPPRSATHCLASNPKAVSDPVGVPECVLPKNAKQRYFGLVSRV